MSEISNCPFCHALVPIERFRTECPRCGTAIDKTLKTAKPKGKSGNSETSKPIHKTPPTELLPFPEPELGSSDSAAIVPPFQLDELNEFEISKPKRKPKKSKPSGGTSVVAPPPIETAALEAVNATASIRTAPSEHERKSRWMGITLMTIGCIAVVVATVLILNSIELFGPEAGKSGSVATTDSQGGSTNTSSDTGTKTAAASGNSADASTKIAERPVQLHFQSQPLRYFRESEITTCWNQVRQSIVELEVTRDGDVWYVPAVILDSKGWITTSYSAIVGASSVVARLAPTSPDESASRRDLSAAITRFVAADPEMDLVMLEVDRRLIEMIQPIQILPRTPVGGTYLMGIGPTFEGWKRWGLETQIANWTDSSAKEFEGKFFQIDRPASSAHPGMPLFDIQGKLAGISTAIFADGRHRAVDATVISRWVSELKSRHTGSNTTQALTSMDQSLAVVQYKPPTFSSPPKNPEPSQPDATSEPEIPTSTVNEIAPNDVKKASLARVQREVQQNSRVCKKFNYVPTNTEELDAMLEFANSLDQVRAVLEIPEDEEGSLNRGEWRNLDRINEDLMDDVMTSVAEINRFVMADSNKIAIQKNAEDPNSAIVVLFVDTIINSMTSPKIDDQPTTVFAVLGQETGVIAIVDPARHVFRDGTRWILVGEIQGPDTRKVMTRENGIVACSQFKLLLPIGPLH